MKAGDMLALRMRSQLLVDSPATSALEVVTHMLAVQAQDFEASQWAIARRTDDLDKTQIHAAYDNGEIVRSWPMRGTLHAVRPSDLQWMLSLTGERIIRGAAARYRELGLDEPTFRKAEKGVVKALRGGNQLSRSEMAAVLVRSGIDVAEQRGNHVIGHLALRGVICWGPMHGKRQALVLLDEWSPPVSLPPRDELLGRYLLGYLRGHGPATLKDFVWWSKLTLADAKVALDVIRARVDEINYESSTYFMVPGAVPSKTLPVVAVPPFDEYYLGYKDRTMMLEAGHAQMVASGGVFAPLLIVNGRVVGTWRRVAKGSHDFEAVAITSISDRTRKAFQREMKRYREFVN